MKITQKELNQLMQKNTNVDSILIGENEDPYACEAYKPVVIKHGNMETDGFDYYIKDALGGVHTDGVGYAPDGAFCGECTRMSCEDCYVLKVK
jgi:hypothetical protein